MLEPTQKQEIFSGLAPQVDTRRVSFNISSLKENTKQ